MFFIILLQQEFNYEFSITNYDFIIQRFHLSVDSQEEMIASNRNL